MYDLPPQNKASRIHTLAARFAAQSPTCSAHSMSPGVSGAPWSGGRPTGYSGSVMATDRQHWDGISGVWTAVLAIGRLADFIQPPQPANAGCQLVTPSAGGSFKQCRNTVSVPRFACIRLFVSRCMSD